MFFLWTPKNMKFSFIFLFRFLFLYSFHALLGISFYGCAGNQVVSSTKEIVSEDNTEPSIKNIEFQGDLKGKLQAVGFTQGVVNDEYLHLNYGQEWLKENLSSCKEELMQANKVNLPLIKKMLDEVAEDASVLAMDKEELMEEFMIAYQDTLLEMGLDNREIARMAMAAIV